MYQHDNRTVVTLDAGGTNFVFGAMRGCEFITEPLRKPSNADDLDRCLATLVEGFGEIISRLDTPPVAISFAFPGPADYPHGIIGGNLPNFPSFRDGVALGPFLEMKFGIPVFINNDGNLFAYGEAMVGALPRISGVRNLTLTAAQQNDMVLEEGVSYRTYSFMAVAPFVGVEFEMTRRMRLVLKADCLLDVSNPQPDFPIGPRIYFGFVFCHLNE